MNFKERKDKRTVISGYVSSDVLTDLLNGDDTPILPEVAAEQAANRIIKAVEKARKERFQTDQSA